jgi:acyl-CoA synthetase (AMP-forming)/AMP-acid ligase II
VQFVVAFLAVARIRAVAAPLNAAYKEDEFTFYIEDAKSSLVIVPDEGVHNAEAAAKTLSLPILSVKFSDLKEGVKVTAKAGIAAGADKATDAGPLPEEEDEALFLHTSGTTSRPKGVPLTHLNLATSIRNIIQTYELTKEDKTLVRNCFSIISIWLAL